MKTIKENIETEITIKKSKFICVLRKINKNVNEILDDVKLEYPGATHYCYAYIDGVKEKCSDDKEPSGTAGIPILNILKHNELDNVLCVVVRYYGGIKLGTGGLSRAYSTSVREAISKCELVNLVTGDIIEITFEIENIKQIDYLLKEVNILNKEFNEIITYDLFVPKTKNIDSIDNLIMEKIIKEENTKRET